MKIWLVAFQPIVQRELTNAQYFEILFFHIFLPSFSGHVFEQTNAQKFFCATETSFQNSRKRSMVATPINCNQLTCIPHLSLCPREKFQSNSINHVRCYWSIHRSLQQETNGNMIKYLAHSIDLKDSFTVAFTCYLGGRNPLNQCLHRLHNNRSCFQVRLSFR